MKNLIISFVVILLTTNAFSQSIAYCSDDPLRVRSSPSVKGEIVGSIETYVKIKVYEHSESREKIGDSEAYWYKVETKDGMQGWAFGAFLDIYDGTDSRLVQNRVASRYSAWVGFSRFIDSTSVLRDGKRDPPPPGFPRAVPPPPGTPPDILINRNSRRRAGVRFQKNATDRDCGKCPGGA